MQIKFKKLHPDAVMPKQGTPGSAGFDLTATNREMRAGVRQFVYHTDIAVEIPKGYVGLVFARSSICRTGLLLTNCVGVIDSDYRGEITAVFDFSHTVLSIDSVYKPGDRICQLVIVPIPEVEYIEVDNLSETERGAGGYGSTGR